MICFRCTGCDKVLKVADTLAGKKITCSYCEKPQEVPAAMENAAPSMARNVLFVIGLLVAVTGIPVALVLLKFFNRNHP
jgi:hypothetical protein